MIETRFFLGSNSPRGFFSLYDDFTDSAQDTLHIIKGFPGTGKSSFMKRIGKVLSEAGADVEYIHCSGDPDSLDGVYFPQLHIAYADGTAPHVTEPRIAGAAEDYLNLGSFCDIGALSLKRREISEINAAYKAFYSKAYDCLAACGAVEKAYASGFDSNIMQRVVRRAQSAALRRLPEKRPYAGRMKRRFLSAVTCRGTVCFTDTVSSLAQRVILLDSALGLAPLFVSSAAEVFLSSGYDVVLLASPFRPEKSDHLIVPELGLAFVSGIEAKHFPGKTVRRVRLDSIPDESERREALQKVREGNRLTSALILGAIGHLERAKALHDALESFYIPNVDFDGINALADRHTDNLLQLWTKIKKGV